MSKNCTNKQLLAYIINFIKKNEEIMDIVDEEWIEDIQSDLGQQILNYEKIILQRAKNSKKLKKILPSLIQSLNNDQKVKIYIQKQKQKPLYAIISKIKPSIININNFFSSGAQVQEWTINLIVKNNLQKQLQFIQQWLKKSQKIQDFISLSLNYVIDYLIRRMDLTHFINSIHKVMRNNFNINQMSELILLRKISIYDFLVLLVKSIDQSQHPQIGNLFYRNKIPLPIINQSLNNNNQKQIHYFPFLLEQILQTKKIKLIFSLGMPINIIKEKESLIYDLFRINCQNNILSQCNFYDGCVSFHTNIPDKQFQLCIVAIYHSFKEEGDINQSEVEFFIKNSAIIILHTTFEQFNDKDKEKSVRQQINKLKDSSKGQVLTVIHNFDKKLKQIQEQNIMIFPSFRNELDTIDRKEWLSNMRQRIKLFLKKENLKQLQMNNIIDKNQLKRLIYDRQQIQGLINLLNEAKNKSNFYEQVFPNLWRERIMSKLCNQRNTLQIQLHDKQMNDQNIISKKYNELEKLQNLINYKEQNKIELKRSQALNYFIQKLQKLKFQNYTHNLAEWKNKETEEIQKQILQLKSKMQYSKLQENKLKLIKLTEEYELYDLSTDTFIQQIIIAEQNMKQGEEDVKLKNMVFDYYQRLHKKKSPINLIQGKTLKFGNQILENFFQEMSKKIVSNKKICVISVIGSQSSAKSTLMNYLFNCSFPTSSGRCTKGVYFTMLQKEESIIIVIDTEGLLSICNRDQTFDVLMVSFILLISDLIIINNKGEINVIIKDLLGICFYCLKSLHVENKQIIKNKLIFVVRDLADEGIQKQQAILSNIISTLTSELNMFNYMDYIDLTSQDIYPLQSAYIQRPLQSQLIIEENNTCFGHSIIVLRQKILKLLLSRKTIHNNIYQFYKESQKKWKLIKQCGINIFNYKYILQKKIKKDLIQKMQRITKYYQSQLREQSKKISKQLDQNSKINIIRNQMNQIILKCIKHSKLRFKEEIKDIKGTKERWINDICLEMEDLFKYRYRNQIQILSRRIKQQKIRSQNILFQEQVNKMIRCILKQNKTQDQIKIQFKNKFEMLIKKEIILLQQKNRSILKQLQNQIQKEQDKIKIYSRQTSLTYKQWSINKCKLIKKSNCQDIEKKNQILNKITQKDQNFKQNLQKLVEQQHDFEFLCVADFLVKINNQCKSYLQRVQKTISDQYKKENFQVQQANFQEYLFSIVRQIVHQKVQNRLDILKKQLQDQRKQMFRQKINKITQNFKIKGNAKQIATQWLHEIRNNVQNECFDKLKKTLKGLVDQAIQNLNPEKMIKKALNQSFLSSKTDKATWLKCYKVVVNINQFLKKQMLYQTTQIKKIQWQLLQEKQKIFQKMIQKYQNYEKLIKQCRNNLGPNNAIEECAKKLNISLFQSSQKSNQAILQQILIILEIQYKQTMNKAQKYFQQTINGNQSHYLLLRGQIFQQIETKVQPKALGCNNLCPMCHIKCKKNKNHTGGHEAVQNSHLMCCFGGVQYLHDNKGSQQCCFTRKTVQENFMYPQKNKNKEITVLKHIEQNHPQWFNHFKQGPYQTKDNQQRCKKAWINIGQMLIKKKQYSHIVYPSTKENQHYAKNTALKQKDISELQGYK